MEFGRWRVDCLVLWLVLPSGQSTPQPSIQFIFKLSDNSNSNGVELGLIAISNSFHGFSRDDRSREQTAAYRYQAAVNGLYREISEGEYFRDSIQSSVRKHWMEE
jgi:hypothetical protein